MRAASPVLRTCSWLEPLALAAPHPVSEITVRQSFSKNQGCGAATYEPERLAVEISSVPTRKMIVIFEIVRLLEILN